MAIGALTRHHDVAESEVLQELCPIVAYAASEIGDPQVRHVGTIGGSVAHADPASDLPTVLLALGAEMIVRGPSGIVRDVPAADFFRGLFDPDLANNEVLTEIRDPKIAGAGGATSSSTAGRRTGRWSASRRVGAHRRAARGWRSRTWGDRPLRASGVEEELAAGGGEVRMRRPPAPTRARARRRTRSRAPSTAASWSRSWCDVRSKRRRPGSASLTLARPSA